MKSMRQMGRCAAALLAAIGICMGSAAAEDEYIARAEAGSGILLGQAKVAASGDCVSKLEQDGDGVEVVITVPEAFT